MKKFALLAALGVTIAGCQQPAEEAEDTAVTEPVAESYVGIWQATTADGMTFTSVLDADGTYQDLGADGTTVESGTWEERTDGRVCFDSDAEDDAVICFAVGDPAEDGSRVVTPDDGGEALTIRRVG